MRANQGVIQVGNLGERGQTAFGPNFESLIRKIGRVETSDTVEDRVKMLTK